MGLFDGLKRDKKAAETVKQHKKEEIVEDELIIDHIEVVERETVKPLVEQEVPPTPIKTIKDKAPVKHVVGQTDRKSTRLNSSHMSESRMPSSA